MAPETANSLSPNLRILDQLPTFKGQALQGNGEVSRSLDAASFSTIETLKGRLSGEERSFYEGLLENFNGAKAWVSQNRLKLTSGLILATTFLTSCAPVGGIAIGQVTPDAVEPVPATETVPPADIESAPFPEELKTALETWAGKQENYQSIITEPAEEGGYNVTIEHTDGTKEQMFMLSPDGTKASFEVDGEMQEVDITLAGTRDTGGYNKFYFGVEPGDNHYMWRYPWGGWVANWDKEFTENGVSIIANEAELYGGLETINLQNVEETWEKLVTSIYNINKGSSNGAILDKYPTIESFLEAAKQGVVFDNLRVLARFSNREEYDTIYGLTWEEIDAITLSSIALGVPQLSQEVAIGYNRKGYSGVPFWGRNGNLVLSYKENGGSQILDFSFVKYLFTDVEVTMDGVETGTWFGLNSADTPEKITESITEMVNYYLLLTKVLGKGKLEEGYVLYREDWIEEGPLFRSYGVNPISSGEISQWDELRVLTTSPFMPQP